MLAKVKLLELKVMFLLALIAPITFAIYIVTLIIRL